MNRRAFLQTVAAVAGAVFLPATATAERQRRWYPQVNGAHQFGRTLHTDGWKPGQVLQRGDIFTISHTNEVHPLTGRSLGMPKRFVVTDDVTADDAGAAELPIYPSIVASGSFRNIDHAPYNDALIHAWEPSPAYQAPCEIASQ